MNSVCKKRKKPAPRKPYLKWKQVLVNIYNNLAYKRYVGITYDVGEQSYTIREKRGIAMLHDYEGKTSYKMYIPFSELKRIEKEIKSMATGSMPCHELKNVNVGDMDYVFEANYGKGGFSNTKRLK